MAHYVALALLTGLNIVSSTCATLAIEYGTDRVYSVYLEAEYSNAIVSQLPQILPKRSFKPCNFFEYEIRCTRGYILAKQWKAVTLKAAARAPEAFNYLKLHGGDYEGDTIDAEFANRKDKLFTPSNLISLVNAVRDAPNNDDANQPIISALPYPGYIPYAAYEGKASILYKTLNANHYLYDLYTGEKVGSDSDLIEYLSDSWYSGTGSYYTAKALNGFVKFSLEPKEYESLFNTIMHDRQDAFGHDLYGDFASVENVIDGEKLVDFWERFVLFSQKADVTHCKECVVAETFDDSRHDVRSIALCTVGSINGVVTMPRDCYTVITRRGKNIFIRSAVYLNAVDGLDGLGAQEMKCTIDLPNTSVDTVADQIMASFKKFFPPDSLYQIGKERLGPNVEVVIANRYGVSAFFTEKRPTYENSTLTFDVYQQSTTDIEISIKISASYSFTNTVRENDYTMIDSKQSNYMRIAIKKTLPDNYKCKIEING